MKKIILLVLVLVSFKPVLSQNQIRLRGGFTSTNTSVSEYDRGAGFYFYDSVSLDTKVLFPSISLDVDVDLGGKFFLTTGLSYMRKGIEGINYTGDNFRYEARQEYMGINLLMKYHYRFEGSRFGLFASGGMRADFTVGGPNNAEIANGNGAEVLQAFGTFQPVEFVLPTVIGASYKLGPGEITFDVNFLKGLTDIIPDQYIVGRTFSMGACLGYSVDLK